MHLNVPVSDLVEMNQTNFAPTDIFVTLVLVAASRLMGLVTSLTTDAKIIQPRGIALIMANQKFTKN